DEAVMVSEHVRHPDVENATDCGTQPGYIVERVAACDDGLLICTPRKAPSIQHHDLIPRVPQVHPGQLHIGGTAGYPDRFGVEPYGELRRPGILERVQKQIRDRISTPRIGGV